MTGGALAGPLLTFAVQSSLLLGAILLLTRMGWLRSARSRDVAWRAGVLFSLGLLAVTASTLSIRKKSEPEVRREVVRRAYVQETESDGWRPTSAMDVASSEIAFGQVETQEGFRIQSRSDLSAECRSALLEERTTPVDHARQIRAACGGEGLSTASTIEWIWLIGALGFGLSLVGRRVRLRRVIGPVHPVQDEGVRRLLAGVVARSGLRGNVELVEGPGLRSPAVLGRRRIGLPVHAREELTRGELEAVLAHEVAHLRRGDRLWIVGMDLLQICFWFQPLLRRARAGMVESAEILCDESALRWTRRPMDLAKSLLRVGEWMVGMTSPAPELGMARGGEGALSDRVRRILGTRPKGSSRGWIAALGLITVVAGLISTVPAVRFDSGVQVDVQIRNIKVADVDR